MDTASKNDRTSIRYTIALEDGTLVSSTVGGDRLDYEAGTGQIFVGLEDALRGMVKGETRRFVLSPAEDPGLKLDVSRLALSLGHPGETLILTAEIL
jgi:FKBP-type peptidyl-prolyl cis-trans isomerase 2